jgi:hypothetical protein
LQDLNDLQCFAQVVRHGFSAASRDRRAQVEAQQTGWLSSSGVCVRLIERSTRSIQVTEIGSDLFAQCEVITGGLEINAVPVIPAKAGVQSLHWQ